MPLNKKNIILIVLLVGTIILTYVYFSKKPEDEGNLISTDSSAGGAIIGSDGVSIVDAKDFLAVLLNVKSITLNDVIFSDPAYATLRDPNIVLVQDGREGRPNPFAPIGFELNLGNTTTPTNDIKNPAN